MDGVTTKTKEAEAVAGGKGEIRSSILVEVLSRQFDIQV